LVISPNLEEKNRYILENIQEIIFTLSLDGTILSLSNEFENVTGWTKEEWTGRHFSELIHPDDKQGIDKKFHQLLQGEITPPNEIRIRAKTKDYLFLEVKTTPQMIDGKVVGLLGLARNITQYKRSIEALRASELQYRAIIDSMGDPIHVIDENLRIILMNPAFLLWLESMARDTNLIGKTIPEAFDFLPGIVLKEYDQVFATGKPLVTEERTVVDNKEYFTQTRKIPIIQNEKVGQILTIIHDITERKQAEKELKESKEKYQNIVQSVRDVIFTIDLDGVITDVSPEFQILTGWSNEEVIDTNYITLVHPDDVQSVLEGFTSTVQGIAPPPYEARARTKSGEYLTFEAKAAPLIVDNKIVGFLGVARDVTERKKIEERLRSFMDAALDTFSLWDSELYLLDVNKKGLEMFPDGTRKEDIIGKNMRDFTENSTQVKEYENVLKTGNPYFDDWTTPHKMFGDVFLSVKAFKVGDGLGLITTDITKRIKDKEKIRESEERFRAIFEESPIGMALTDIEENNFQFIKVNAAFCQMLGYSEPELIDLSFPKITHPDDIKRDVEHAKKLATGEISIYRTEKRYFRKDQKIIWVHLTASLLRDKEGQPNYYLTMIEDITTRKQQEEEAKQKLLKYHIEDGNIYLIKEKTPSVSQTVFTDLTEIGYNGTIISRTPQRNYKIHSEGAFKFLQLTEENDNKKIIKMLEEAPHRSVFLIDRLEYLFLREGFENTIRFVFKLSEVTYLSKIIVLVSIDESTLTERQLSILEKETQQIIPRFLDKMSKEILDILRYIYQQNNLGLKPSYSDIGGELKLSRPTVRKRIKRLVFTGYLAENRKGKTKVLEVVGKGRSLFMNQ
jgi:PAS domain S-box-containing protein